ncbi:hypothetical protein [Crocosphaera sp.]|uniref:hypothetical protein n=1 Tax=Crocosphaera sp. TaxID=2729996 RepID=UPI003F1F5BF7|nr:hypothetical protein [Crocosphaera sp.]
MPFWRSQFKIVATQFILLVATHPPPILVIILGTGVDVANSRLRIFGLVGG